jgi:hypothetical protein
MKTLELIGKRAFIGSNTYHVAVAFLDGIEVARVNFSYGYEDQWLYNLVEALNKQDCNLPACEEKEVPWKFINRLKAQGYRVTTSVSDVKGRKNLVV